MVWGFWDGNHWRSDAPVYRRDWTLKPSGRAYLDLVRGEWWTDERGETDADGAFAVRGFLGDYEIRVRADGREAVRSATLGPGGAVAVVPLHPQ